MSVEDHARKLGDRLKDLPVLVTRAEVLEYLAKLSSNMAGWLGTGSTICDIARDAHDPSLDRLAAVWKAKLPAPDLQIAAAQDAATYLRSLAAEDRIIAARTAADQARREPTRG